MAVRSSGRNIRNALSGLSKRIDKVTAGSLSWLVERYRETTAWTTFSLATRRQRELILRHVLATAGHVQATKITPAHIAAGRNSRSATPVTSRHFLDTMRGLFGWAVEAQHIKTNPTLGVKYPKLPNTGGFVPSSQDHIPTYAPPSPIGTPHPV